MGMSASTSLSYTHPTPVLLVSVHPTSVSLFKYRQTPTYIPIFLFHNTKGIIRYTLFYSLPFKT